MRDELLKLLLKLTFSRGVRGVSLGYMAEGDEKQSIHLSIVVLFGREKRHCLLRASPAKVQICSTCNGKGQALRVQRSNFGGSVLGFINEKHSD